jgi:myo-inositol-1(or 4)-monophosphatase
MHYDSLLQCAEETATRAGEEILLKGFISEDKDLSFKGQTDIVTKFDREAEEFICASIRKRFPGHGILAEEGTGTLSDHDLVWIVDPLDATTNFAHGIPHYCVSIGVYSRSVKKTVIGVVYEPNRKELYSSAKGEGAFLNGSRIKVTATADLADSLLATGFPYQKADPRISNLPQLNKILPLVRCVRRMGSAALDLCYVACGRIDGYWEPMLHPWDMAAGSLIVEEAGGSVSDYEGESFNPVCPEIIASNGKIQEKLVGLIRETTEILPRKIAARKFF